LHRKLLKKHNQTKKLLVKQIDEIIYLLARVQYVAPISKKELGGDPHMAMMKEMFKTGHFEYLDNIALIKENVGKVELLLQRQVARPDQREQVHLSQKKLKRLQILNKIFGYFCTIGTLGVYNLFW
jgi:hypothetical protein